MSRSCKTSGCSSPAFRSTWPSPDRASFLSSRAGTLPAKAGRSVPLTNLNPRFNTHVALPKPSDRERAQWYFQRYVDWLPAAGETVLFDRSWYNRAGVEPVMGFCTPEETATFLDETPGFEQMLVRDGIVLMKFYLVIGREMQMKRFHDRRHDPLKRWKLSPVDLEALARFDAYTAARDEMFAATHTVPRRGRS